MHECVLLVKIDKPGGGPLRVSFSEPIGICYIAAYLKSQGVQCHLSHVIRDEAKTEIVRLVREYSPTAIGFSTRNFNFNTVCDCIMIIRSTFPEIKILLGGECITMTNAKALCQRTDADLVIVSDGEETVHAYLLGISPQEIPGVAYRNPTGNFSSNTFLARRVDPARLPMMDRTGLPMTSYSAEAFPNKRYATMHTQRGCRYKCTFCHTATRYDTPLSRSVEQILDEIDFLTVQHKIEALAIWDEDFFADLNRVEAIAHALLDRGTPVQWHTFMKLTDLKSKRLVKLLPLLRDAGYMRAVIGLESFIPKTLRLYHKAGGPGIEESLQFLSDQGIRICPAYIIGAPEETEKDIAYGLSHLLRLRDRGINIEMPYVAFLTPFPGTPLYESYSQSGLLLDANWEHYDGEHVLVKSQCPPDIMLKLRDEFYASFYGGHDD